MSSDELGHDFLVRDARDRGTVGLHIAMNSDCATTLRPMQVQTLVPGSWANLVGEILEGDEILAGRYMIYARVSMNIYMYI